MDYTKYIGIPFEHNGRSKDGYDCWGLVKELYLNKYNEVLPDFVYDKASEDTVGLFFAEELGVKCVWKEVEPREGTIVVFAIGGIIRHAGFMINNHEFIHTIQGTLTVIESIKNLRWSGRFKGCYIWQP